MTENSDLSVDLTEISDMLEKENLFQVQGLEMLESENSFSSSSSSMKIKSVKIEINTNDHEEKTPIKMISLSKGDCSRK